jgi:hypothetical protein
MTCHHLYDDGACIHCGQFQVQPAAQGYTARWALRCSETLLKALSVPLTPDAYHDTHDAAEGLAAALDLYPQREAFLGAEFLLDACASLRLLGLKRQRTRAVTQALRDETLLSLRQACDMFRDWERAAELAHGRDVARRGE